MEHTQARQSLARRYVTSRPLLSIIAFASGLRPFGLSLVRNRAISPSEPDRARSNWRAGVVKRAHRHLRSRQGLPVQLNPSGRGLSNELRADDCENGLRVRPVGSARACDPWPSCAYGAFWEAGAATVAHHAPSVLEGAAVAGLRGARLAGADSIKAETQSSKSANKMRLRSAAKKRRVSSSARRIPLVQLQKGGAGGWLRDARCARAACGVHRP
eukprot:2298236-Pleurochrysis_carterae.AAC.5